MESPSDIPSLNRSQQHALETLSKPAGTQEILPPAVQIQKASNSLASSLPDQGYGIETTTAHILDDIAPALNGQALSPRYYGFVTGGITPAARVAESIVATYDQNVQVHLPETTITTTVEDRALELLLELLDFEVEAWQDRTFTTGATASNIIGLACGREYVVNEALQKRKKQGTNHALVTVGEIGLLAACRAADITSIQILTTLPHSSLKKAASIVGLGRACFHRVSEAEHGLEFDLKSLEDRLNQPNTASIIVISCAEVNTGKFATHSYGDVNALRSLCDQYGAWLHVDAEGLELADSIAGDAHKLLNVPYDCGFFISRHVGLAQQVFRNPNAAYLSSGDPSPDQIQSPLNIGLENSRRFRALPVYATLVSYGRTGYKDMLQQQIRFARRIASYFSRHQDFDLLPQDLIGEDNINRETYIIVLFRAKDNALNSTLVRRLNASSQIYVSGTTWQGRQACRIAVANWQVDPERDLTVVQEVVEKVLGDWRQGSL
ncbi:MAG: hypothetical protein Q9179_002736 [Wetmoreana sp. 5 TL-2023]